MSGQYQRLPATSFCGVNSGLALRHSDNASNFGFARHLPGRSRGWGLAGIRHKPAVDPDHAGGSDFQRRIDMPGEAGGFWEIEVAFLVVVEAASRGYVHVFDVAHRCA